MLVDLPADTSALALARAAVADALDSTDPSHPRRHDLELIASELVSNALRHGQPPITLAVDVGESAVATPSVRITVASQGGDDPRVLTPTAHATTGRGLAMVAAIADRWGWERDGATLRVHAEIDGHARTSH